MLDTVNELATAIHMAATPHARDQYGQIWMPDREFTARLSSILHAALQKRERINRSGAMLEAAQKAYGDV